MAYFYIRGGLWKFALRFDEARLEVDDIIAQLVVFCLNGFVALTEEVIVLNLLFQFLDVSLFPLSKRTL